MFIMGKAGKRILATQGWDGVFLFTTKQSKVKLTFLSGLIEVLLYLIWGVAKRTADRCRLSSSTLMQNIPTVYYVMLEAI